MAKSSAMLVPSYNVASSREVAVIINNKSTRELLLYRWGFLPSWAKALSLGNKMINARSETVATKPVFRSAFKKHRCLIIADGFYEWRKVGTGKVPYYIHLK